MPPPPNSEGVLVDTGACCSSASFPSSEDISDTVAPPPPNSEGVLVDTGASCSSELIIKRPLKSILKRRHCPSIIIQPSSPSSEDISDTVPPPPLKRQQMFSEYTVGREGSPTKLVKEELIKHFPNIQTPIIISDSPEPSPVKEPPITPTIESINEHRERGPCREVNFSEQVLQYEFAVESITKCTRGRRSSLPITEQRLQANEKKIESAKSPERKQHYEQVKANLEARTKKVHALNHADQRAKVALSKSKATDIDYESRERVKEEEILKWKNQDHIIKFLGRWVRCSSTL